MVVPIPVQNSAPLHRPGTLLVQRMLRVSVPLSNEPTALLLSLHLRTLYSCPHPRPRFFFAMGCKEKLFSHFYYRLTAAKRGKAVFSLRQLFITSERSFVHDAEMNYVDSEANTIRFCLFIFVQKFTTAPRALLKAALHFHPPRVV